MGFWSNWRLGRRLSAELPWGTHLRLLSALEVLEARRETDALARSSGELALCRNACLLARALVRRGRPVFADGQAALDGLTASEIGRLCALWAELDRRENPSARLGREGVDALKKDWSTRRGNACGGGCSAPFRCCPTNRRLWR